MGLVTGVRHSQVAKTPRLSIAELLFLPRRLTVPTKADVLAGSSVGLVAVPQSLAYAELAGLPAVHGLYAAALPAIVAAVFVSARHLQTGPAALTALLTFGALSPLAPPMSADYLRLAVTLALLVGLFRVLFGLLRLGRISFVLSDPVMSGFNTGAAVLIIASQVPKVLGVAPAGGDAASGTAEHPGVLGAAADAVSDIGGWRVEALCIAVGSAALVVAGRRIHALFPGVLIAVVGSVLFSLITGYDGAVVGRVDAGWLPAFGVGFAWSSLSALILPALAIALVGFAEPASIARTFSAAERRSWNADKELFGQGMANITSALSGGFPVGGSFARSSLTRLAGADSAWAGAATGAVVLLSLPLMPILAPLPTAVLGAVVIVGALGLIKVGPMLQLARQSSVQAVVAAGTVVATLAFAPRIERGVFVGILLALAAHLYREVTSVRIDSVYRGQRLVVRLQGVVWFLTVAEVESRIGRTLAEHSTVNEVDIDLGGVGRLDYTGAAALARLAENLAQSGVRVRFRRIPAGAARAAAAHLSPFDDRVEQPRT